MQPRATESLYVRSCDEVCQVMQEFYLSIEVVRNALADSLPLY
jgi:hypothetical protein